MSSRNTNTHHPLSESHTSATFPSSDSENYDANNSSNDHSSPPPPSSSSSPLILYSPPTFWSILRGAAINIFLPFVNGLMLGFGELVAHEAAWWMGWGGTKIFPTTRNSRSMGPGVEVKEDIMERKRRNGQEMDELTSLE